MNKPEFIGKVGAIVLAAFVGLIVSTSFAFAILLARTSRYAASRRDSTVDISRMHLLQVQESPKNSAVRLNAIWRERSQTQ